MFCLLNSNFSEFDFFRSDQGWLSLCISFKDTHSPLSLFVTSNLIVELIWSLLNFWLCVDTLFSTINWQGPIPGSSSDGVKFKILIECASLIWGVNKAALFLVDRHVVEGGHHEHGEGERDSTNANRLRIVSSIGRETKNYCRGHVIYQHNTNPWKTNNCYKRYKKAFEREKKI